MGILYPILCLQAKTSYHPLFEAKWRHCTNSLFGSELLICRSSVTPIQSQVRLHSTVFSVHGLVLLALIKKFIQERRIKNHSCECQVFLDHAKMNLSASITVTATHKAPRSAHSMTTHCISNYRFCWRSFDSYYSFEYFTRYVLDDRKLMFCKPTPYKSQTWLVTCQQQTVYVSLV